jgi:hypothetical protein
MGVDLAAGHRRPHKHRGAISLEPVMEESVVINGQESAIAWHSADDPPAGTPHGAAAVCVTADHQVMLVSRDSEAWDLPAGRSEPGESWIDTLTREVDEEACATVNRSTLLGFSRGECVRGHERGRLGRVHQPDNLSVSCRGGP